MGIVPFSVPLHRLVLNCGLAQGEVSVGVRPQFPVKGVHMILGNDLAGDRVWAKGQPKGVKSNLFIAHFIRHELNVLQEIKAKMHCIT